MKKYENLEGLICITYRCNAKCQTCHIWKNTTKKSEEIKPEDLDSLPYMRATNVTGGEPFIRDDIDEILDVLLSKTKRLVFSTNGFFTDRILDIAKRYPEIGVRISIEGLPKANDELRGINDGFDKGIRTLIELLHMGFKDVGFGITVSDLNAKDLLELYHLAKAMKVEFATAVLHNSHYFNKFDNRIEKVDLVSNEFKKLIDELLKSRRPKDWYRAYFNYGIINRVNGGQRLLPCRMGTDAFFIDPYGDVLPCNGMDRKVSMGNIKEKTFDEIWNSDRADEIRNMVSNCDKRCWMIGSVSPAMKKNFWNVTKWIIKHKFLGEKIEIARLLEGQ